MLYGMIFKAVIDNIYVKFDTSEIWSQGQNSGKMCEWI